MARQRGSITLGVVIGFGVVAYLFSRKSSAQSVSSSPVPGVQFQPSTVMPGYQTSYLTAVPAVTQAQAQSSNSFWNSLQPVNGPGSGYINLPTGSQPSAAFMPFAMDSNGNYYTEWAGQVFRVGNQDLYGNWSATLVA